MIALAQLKHFFAMGGYAAYVWPSYGLALLILGGNAWWSRHLRRATFKSVAKKRERQSV